MGKGEACEQCKHNCLRIHGKNMTSPPIMSFFKIMIGANFSKFMYLPPKFGRTVSNLVGEKVSLEDTNGHQWVVTVRNVDNSIAFKQGWPSFSSDHGLNFGDFVIFHYLSETSFVVHVYDNSGCEKKNFPSKGYPSKKPRTENCISGDAPKCHTNDNFPKKGYPSKKPRNGEQFIAKDGPKCHTSDKSSMNKQDSNTSATKSDLEINQNHCDTSNLHNIVDARPTKNPSKCVTSSGKPLPVFRPNSIEESFIMINRDLGIKQEDDRTTSMFDLSNFEMPSNVAVVNRISVRSSPKRSDLLIESQPRGCTMSQDSVVVPEIFLAKDSCNKKTMETTSVLKPGGDKEDIPDMVIKRCQFEKPSVNISNETLFGDNQINKTKMYQTQCRSDDLNSLQEATEVSDISRFSAPSRLQKYQKEPKDNQVSASKMNPIFNRASPNIIPKGKEPKIMKGSQSHSFNPTINGAMKVVINEPINTEIPRFSVFNEPKNYHKGKESKFMKGSQRQIFSPTINGAIKVVKNEPTDNEIPRSSVSSSLQNRREKMMMDFKRKIRTTKEFFDLTPERYSPEEMIQGISGNESKFTKGSQSQGFSLTINEAVKMVKVEPMVKNELIKTDDSSPSFLRLSCLVSTNNLSFFELPSCLPPFKGKAKYVNTVYLQDSVMRRWPVVYHERYNLQVLTTGWEAFSRANSIQQGDECGFELENSQDAIFKVHIIQRF